MTVVIVPEAGEPMSSVLKRLRKETGGILGEAKRRRRDGKRCTELQIRDIAS